MHGHPFAEVDYVASRMSARKPGVPPLPELLGINFASFLFQLVKKGVRYGKRIEFRHYC